MSFRISTVRDNGSREQSVVIEKGQAQINSASDSDLQCPLPENVVINVTETPRGLDLEVSGAGLNLKGAEKTGKVTISGGADFEVSGISFYITKQLLSSSTPRKKAMLSGFGLAMVWVLLVVMLAAPFVLDAQIKTKETKGVYALADKCAQYLDDLREMMKSEMSKLSGYTQAHQDIVKALNEEIEQLAWTFRKGGNYMSVEQLSILEKDIRRYRQAVKKLRHSDTVKVSPLESGAVLDAIIPAK